MNKFGKIITGVATAATAGLSFAGMASPAQAAGSGPILAHNEFGYAYPNSPDCDERVGSTIGCVHEKWHFYQGQCVSWVAYRLNTLSKQWMDDYNYRGITHWGSATDWGSEARRIGIPVNETPARGAVAWYAHGHVAFVEHVNSNGTVVVSEMNYLDHNEFRTVTISKNYRWPTAFIHFKDLPNDETEYFTTKDGSLMKAYLPAEGSTDKANVVRVGSSWAHMRLTTEVPDVTGDGIPDVVSTNSSGNFYLYKSNGANHLSSPVQIGSGWQNMTSLSAIGSDGTGKVSLVGVGANGKVSKYTLSSTNVTNAGILISSSNIKSIAGVGDINSDRKDDFLATDTSGNNALWYATSSGGVSFVKNIGKASSTPGAMVSSPISSSNKITVLTPSGVLMTRHVSDAGFYGTNIVTTGISNPYELG